MRAEVFSNNGWIFPDTVGGASSADIKCAKGSYANFQLIIDDADTAIEWSVEYDTEFVGKAELYRLLTVTVNRNSDFFEPLDPYVRPSEELAKHFTKKAPFEVYDPMLPIMGNCFEARGRTALYVSIKIPTGIPSGEYTGRIIFGSAADTIRVPFKIKVYDITVPVEKTLNIANWSSFSTKAYGCTPFDEKYWDTLYKIAKLGLRARQNCIYLTTAFVDCTYENGRYTYDFANAERYICDLLDMGYTRIEAFHITGIYNRFIKRYEGDDVYSENGRKTLSYFLEQWYAFICKKGWNKKVIQHIGDEPKDNNAARYKELCLFVKEHMPDIPVVEAVLTPDVCDVVDIPVPLTRHYQLHKSEYDMMFKDKKEVWMYTCCWPIAPYLNRFLDMPILSVRLLHWLNFKLGFCGYLHWGFCAQADFQDVYKEPSVAFKYMGVPDSDQFLPAGDTNIVYPTPDGPIGSVRLEMMRAGAEDYELLKILESCGGRDAQILVDTVIDGDWCAAVNYLDFDDIYEKLLETGKNI